MRSAIVSLAVVVLTSALFGQSAPETPQTAATASSAKAQPPAAPAPRVFLQAQSKGNNRNASRDQSMEMSKDFEEVCPGVRITISQQMADYTVLLNHIEVGLLVRDNQFQLADKNGDLLSKTKEGGSIKSGVKKVCDLILADWNKKGPSSPATAEAPIPSSSQEAPAPIASSGPVPIQVAISSIPDGADIEIDGSFVGNAPSAIELTPGEHTVVVHRKGFQKWERKIKVSGGSISLRAELDAAGQ
jgi:hypothetical protein